jgi:hypothetical protein
MEDPGGGHGLDGVRVGPQEEGGHWMGCQGAGTQDKGRTLDGGGVSGVGPQEKG